MINVSFSIISFCPFKRIEILYPTLWDCMCGGDIDKAVYLLFVVYSYVQIVLLHAPFMCWTPASYTECAVKLISHWFIPQYYSLAFTDQSNSSISAFVCLLNESIHSTNPLPAALLTDFYRLIEIVSLKCQSGFHHDKRLHTTSVDEDFNYSFWSLRESVARLKSYIAWGLNSSFNNSPGFSY